MPQPVQIGIPPAPKVPFQPGVQPILFKLPVFVHTIDGAAFQFLELTIEQLQQLREDNHDLLYGDISPQDDIVGSGDPVSTALAAQSGTGK